MFEELVQKGLVKKKTYANGLSVFKYSRKVFYDQLWNTDPLLLEARGIVLDDDGNKVVWPFTKVFNYGENGAGELLEASTPVVAPRKVNGFMAACRYWNGELIVSTTGSLDSDFAVLAREGFGPQPGKLVVRPDSGDPVNVICGFKVVDTTREALENNNDRAEFYELGYDYVRVDGKYFEITNEGYDSWYGCDLYDYLQVEVSEAEVKGAIAVLYETFGGTVTETGHKLLDSHIGLIYGDSITTKRAEEILRRLAENGYAAANVVFGVGSFTYQCNTRDTFGFAVKATNSVINDEEVAIFKDPKTDSKKKSAKGRLFVGQELAFDDGKDQFYGDFELMDEVPLETEQSENNLLKVFYRDGVFLSRVTLDEIRERSK